MSYRDALEAAVARADAAEAENVRLHKELVELKRGGKVAWTASAFGTCMGITTWMTLMTLLGALFMFQHCEG